MTTAVNESKILIEIENFVENISITKHKPRNFYNQLTGLLIQFDQIYNPDYSYVPAIETVIELLLDLEGYQDDPECLYERLIKISFEDIQRDFKWHYRRHKRQLRDHRVSESRNTKVLVNRMQRISSQYSRILVVRVDLAYPLKYQNQIGIQQFSDDMDVLRTRLRDQDKVFKGLIEYAWALEQGVDKGYHCHLLLVYRGSERRNAYSVADRVGKLWKDITEEQGCHFNCHTAAYLKQFTDRNRLGIGMIHRNSSDEVDNMLNTVKYLVRPEKESQHLRVKTRKRMHTFG
ncbi:YagK/YfjJ domain-containing protein [Acinetobacter sp. WCHAc010052]|uniref:YagK/YfjJ domain-containing protein n=1 Tax=Acinetobacter sp. WCHAc010052 TaxID=2004647 RepID=UPI000B3BE6A3|nr:inovirus-type Gp2 protein [Acinetobacter sp. WCHAc010052]AXY60999.1 inovirus Gp2 family protein [Acinetobacter sp. WCHAc010052]